MYDKTFDHAVQNLRENGTPFVVATVVRTLAGTAATPGDKAIFLADGFMALGWIGGGCTKSAIRQAATEAMADGKPRFVSLRPEDLLAAEGVAAGQERDGVRFARNGCPSEGSLDIFVEPVLPRPELVILGKSPVAMALAEQAGRFGLFRTLAAPDLPEDTPEVERRSSAFSTPPGADTRYVVVATQGEGDRGALEAALAADPAYLGFVGSRRKFQSLADGLEAGGVARALLDRVRAPAGLDIAAITPDEIAMSILAEITALRRGGQRKRQHG